MAPEEEARYMAAALALARRNLGRAWPNPAVGCVLVGETRGRPRIVGRGWTGPGGRPHAETEALDQAGPNARGATAFVTLEPCSHHGRTPPCAEALAAAGVARVVSAIADPDPRVDGSGHAVLRDRGVGVATGVLADQARDLNSGFLTRIACARPWITLKLAMSANGMIAAGPGKPTTITSEAARERSHMMRALSDAIMVGAGTWRTDDPRLTCRLPGMRDRSPVRVVLDARAELPPESRLVASAHEVPLWLVVSRDAPASRRAGLERSGAVLIESRTTGRGRFDPVALFRELAGRGLTRLLVEGGAALADSLIEAGQIDEIVLFTAPQPLGVAGIAAPAALRPGGIDRNPRFRLVIDERIGPDRLTAYRRL